jgi:uncharacterized membrane protein YbhN (UPF0104 family)
MLALLGTLGTGIGRGTAAAATFVTRACTLWFAVAIGVAALAIYSRRRPSEAPLSVSPPVAGAEIE